MNKKSNTHFDFDPIAARYDRCNHLFSLGLDRLWRKKTVRRLEPKPTDAVLDLCCGTGDMVFGFLRHSPVRTVAGVDISEPMIHLAQVKQILYGPQKWMHGATLRWHAADAVRTGLDDASVDIITCAFGIRNIPDRGAALNEMHRLLRPGGKAGILEFSLPHNPLLRGLYVLYFAGLMPLLGGLVFRQRQPLRYLATSVQKWHTEVDFAAELHTAGFRLSQKIPMTCGIVTLWVAEKL